MDETLKQELEGILQHGLARDALEHAEQVAKIAAVLHRAFSASGLRSTIVGGSAIELHAPGIYVSGDIDLVVEKLDKQSRGISVVFDALGFQKEGRHWRIRDLFVEVPSQVLLDPSEFMRVGSAVFEVVTKEVVLADRIVGYRQ